MSIFRNSDAEKITVVGVVSRVGPWLGPGQVSGIVLMLEDDPQTYVVLRDDQSNLYPIGLTKPGDKVRMQARSDGTVALSTYFNADLDSLRSNKRHREGTSV